MGSVVSLETSIKLLSSSGREAKFTVADLFPLKPVMLLMPNNILLAWLVLNGSSTLFYIVVWRL